MAAPDPAWQDGKYAGIPLIFLFAWAALFTGKLMFDHHVDRMNEPFLMASTFVVRPNCPVRLKQEDDLPRRCVDPRYRIRSNTARFGLRYYSKTYGWVRAGGDAIRLDCLGEACTVREVARRIFPTSRP